MENGMAKEKKKEELTLEYLHQIMRYGTESGDFIRLVTVGARGKVGDVAGSINGKGYIDIKIRYKSYRANILAWFYMTGEWPEGEVEHKDQDKTNNAWSNLRIASSSENSANRYKNKNNTSGYKGVYLHKGTEKWMAKIGYNNKLIYLGYFDCKLEAAKAYDKAALEHHGIYACLNFPQEDTK